MPRSSPRALRQYSDLADLLRRQIVAGELRPGQKLATFKAMSAEFGLHTHTINRALMVLESEGHIIRRGGSGIYVARGDQRKKNGLIGFVGITNDGLHNPYWAQLLQGIQDIVDHESTQVVLLKDFANAGGWDRVDGVLTCGEIGPSLSRLSAGIPALALLTPDTTMGGVLMDDFDGARSATRHLLELGHRRIARIVSEIDHPICLRRNEGHAAALKDAGLKTDARYIHELHPMWHGENSRFFEAGKLVMSRWLAEDWHELGCTAVLAQNDWTARGIIAAIEGAGLSVPGDISVVGFDGADEANSGTLSLTTVQIPLREMGEEAARMLLRRIEGNEVESVTLPVRLRLGQSTAAPKPH